MNQMRVPALCQRAISLALVSLGLLNPTGAEERGDRPTSIAPHSSLQGRETFRSRCAACHGLDGRGGEHGPDIVTSPKVRGISDRALFAIITHGIPRAGMPAFGLLLEPEEIRAVVGCMRRAGGKGAMARVPGDPARGEALFFGKAACGDCHMVRGKGGFLGADLSDYGQDHSAPQILSAILHPGAGPVRETVTAITRNGQQWTGIARNEDNFSIQLLDTKGVFHLIMKSDLASLKREPRSLMPDDYGARLSSIELDDLVDYLARSAAAPSTRTP